MDSKSTMTIRYFHLRDGWIDALSWETENTGAALVKEASESLSDFRNAHKDPSSVLAGIKINDKFFAGDIE